MTRIMLVLLISPFIISLLLSSPALAIDLRTAAQESYPKFYRNNGGQIMGLEMDIMKAINQVAPSIHFVGDKNDAIRMVPWKRIQTMLLDNRLDIIFGIADTAKRRAKGMIFFPTPLYKISYVFAMAIDDPALISSLDDIEALKLNGRILALSGSASAMALKKQYPQLIIDDQGPTVKKNMEKLIKTRGRFFYYHDLGILSFIKREQLQSSIKILPLAVTSSYHKVAYSSALPKEAILKISNALQVLKGNGELITIFQNYTQ